MQKQNGLKARYLLGWLDFFQGKHEKCLLFCQREEPFLWKTFCT